MTTKLVSANMGIVLIVERDGQERKVEFSVVSPSAKARQLNDALFFLREFLNDEFGIDVTQHSVKIAKPKKIKAPRALTHKQFNKKIGELVP
jgi:hypothetical protein